jgi:acyl-coenzyme A synthetase/AMP-(fatty) acid ligase
MVKDVDELNLNYITLGGEIADKLILSQLKITFNNAKIRHIYASTETGVGLSVVDGKAGFPLIWINNSTKKPQLKISDESHLMIKQEVLMPDTINDLILDAQGFYDTGDIVKVEENRVLFIGRESGVINVGGSKVFPEHVESIIRQFDNIADVRVFGQPNAIIGQLVAADIVLKQPVDDEKSFKQQLLNHCKKVLSKHQLPMLLFLKKELATNAANKIKRGC